MKDNDECLNSKQEEVLPCRSFYYLYFTVLRIEFRDLPNPVLLEPQSNTRPGGLNSGPCALQAGQKFLFLNRSTSMGMSNKNNMLNVIHMPKQDKNLFRYSEEAKNLFCLLGGRKHEDLSVI
jgi:hypothetical protein